MNKAREHNTSLYPDLWKAYDSVPRDVLWHVFRKCGSAPPLVNITRSLHDGMKAETTIPEIEVTNSLRQGCTIAPTLFNIYFNFVIEQWHKWSQPFGVEVHYKCGGNLLGETRKPTGTELSLQVWWAHHEKRSREQLQHRTRWY